MVKKTKDIVTELREKYAKQNTRMLYANSDECYEKSQRLLRGGGNSYYVRPETVLPLTAINATVSRISEPEITVELKTRLTELRNEHKVKFSGKKIIVIDQRDLKNVPIATRKKSLLSKDISREISHEIRK